MPLQVLPATSADLVRSAEIERLAYGPNPFEPYLFPGPFPSGGYKEDRAKELQRFLAEDPTTQWYKVVDDELSGEEAMIAFAKWNIYDPKPAPKSVRTFGPGCNVEACEYMFGGLAKTKQRLVGDQPHIYLHMLHTDPNHQRRGAAKMLLRWGVDEAERRNLPAYLDASEEGSALYQRVGFQIVEETQLDFRKWGAPKLFPIWHMIKEPSVKRPA